MNNFQVYVAEGNMTSDPKVTYTPEGGAVASFSVAINSQYKEVESVLFMPCVAFGKLAEILIKYGVKGKKVLISGELRDDSYTNQSSVVIHRIKLRLSTVRFIGAFVKNDDSLVNPTPDNNDATDNEVF